mmetsp:Transcript_20357/g.9438  ORF Transcript_20357/g.9438 Transcript_20357/m.9438 type:complete len:108 (-) Transcript_20357:47-370(-)
MVAIVVSVFLYIWFSSDQCNNLTVFISIMIAVGVLFTLLSISPLVENKGLLTSSALNVYCLYLCWSALASYDDYECNDWTDEAATIWDILVGVCFTFLALIYVAVRT